MDHCSFSKGCNANAVVLLDEVEYKVLHCNLEHTHPDETFEKLRDAFKSIEIAAQTGKKPLLPQVHLDIRDMIFLLGDH
ncbi:hypothetical protein ACTXT7_002258 [Hymenolepis weldensis]